MCSEMIEKYQKVVVVSRGVLLKYTTAHIESCECSGS